MYSSYSYSSALASAFLFDSNCNGNINLDLLNILIPNLNSAIYKELQNFDISNYSYSGNLLDIPSLSILVKSSTSNILSVSINGEKTCITSIDKNSSTIDVYFNEINLSIDTVIGGITSRSIIQVEGKISLRAICFNSKQSLSLSIIDVIIPKENVKINTFTPQDMIYNLIYPLIKSFLLDVKIVLDLPETVRGYLCL